MCEVSAKNIEPYGTSSKFSVFSDKKPGLSKTIELYLNFYMGFCVTELALSNHNKISP